MQQTYKEIFNHLPESCRVWVYHNQGEIAPELQGDIQTKLDVFIAEWAAHGSQLHGASTILEDRFIVLTVDEAQTIASGCSIDTSIRFMKELAKEFNLNLFDRLNVIIEENGEKKSVHFSDLSNHKGAIFFNPAVTSLRQFREEWKTVIS